MNSENLNTTEYSELSVFLQENNVIIPSKDKVLDIYEMIEQVFELNFKLDLILDLFILGFLIFTKHYTIIYSQKFGI
jgi:hypothetical protein